LLIGLRVKAYVLPRRQGITSIFFKWDVVKDEIEVLADTKCIDGLHVQEEVHMKHCHHEQSKPTIVWIVSNIIIHKEELWHETKLHEGGCTIEETVGLKLCPEADLIVVKVHCTAVSGVVAFRPAAAMASV
jgi:hypothetical protein